MVNTWHDSWFSESGVRVLYTLPENWTDKTLPLAITPKPVSIKRVMVGRAEVITPQMEWNLLQKVVKFNSTDATTKSAAVKETIDLGLGRFAEPAMRRLVTRNNTAEFSRTAWGLLEAVSKVKPVQQKLVSR
jgi:hypothetical protein